jgi:glycolate oxidase iron-sulfur subunit
MLREDPNSPVAAQISALARISPVSRRIDLTPSSLQGDVTIAYHSACSLQHGQKITHASKVAFRMDSW